MKKVSTSLFTFNNVKIYGYTGAMDRYLGASDSTLPSCPCSNDDFFESHCTFSEKYAFQDDADRDVQMA